MEKRRVALLCTQDLLGESITHLLSHIEDITVIACWSLGDPALPRLLAEAPDLLLIADEEPFSEAMARLTAQLMEACPDLPIVRITLSQNVLRVYTAQSMPARSAELLEMIRRLPVRSSVAAKDDSPPG
jgi:DNA-binding NarL/FixJ family response regulator